jgi:hypothetical protein
MSAGMKAAFDWDESNVSHIARHGVTPGEAEAVIGSRWIPTAFPAEEKWQALWRHIQGGQNA